MISSKTDLNHIFPSKFLFEIFFGCKMITSKTDLNQNFSWRFFWSGIYGCKMISSKIALKKISKFFRSNIFWVQNDFLENRFIPIIFIKNLLVKISFMVAKWFPRKQVWTKHFHQKVFFKIFYGCKIISSKIGFN